ncbi:MAG: biopolymer transporter ExbD [Luminiphilus sp.]|nr:biopolymer transporter ExbD [Luminiphilus sp.]MDG1506721.1 biopolymer transporter ExbD [Luminiphilus sp.]MDG1653986.1 biopolymer transporter ExbD [Luminiphilus sp.]
MKFKRQRRDSLAVNVTPLIDVVFLLLIFFMVSTSFTDLSELVVNLPEAEGESVQDQTKGLEIIITAGGAMFLNGTPFPADAENLRAIIIEKSGSRRDIPVSIVADGETRHAMVVMSMDTVSQLGFERLSISTQKPLSGE